MFSQKSKKSGYFVILILVFGSIFLFMLTAFTGLLVTQKRASGTAVASERALHIAEAGLEYYRWYLAHNPGDTTNGTTTPQPYIHRYTDPQTGEIGQFELTVEGAQSACGYIGAVDITSVGRLDSDPDKPRAIFGRYTRPNVAEYSFIGNSNLWSYHSDITGPYHTNGGINMQSTNNSIVTSAVSTWTCTGDQGCNPSQTKPGIFGTGPNSTLWQFPVPPIDFAGMSVDLTAMKTYAQSSGRYFGTSGSQGYEVIFKSDDTFDLYRVNSTVSVFSNTGTSSGNEQNIINTKTLVGNYTIPDNCAVIFLEDKVWLKGEITKKVSIAAARPTHSSDPSIIIHGNITYTTDDGSAGLLAIAEDDMLLALNAPENTEINGIFIAQKGAVRRNGYCTGFFCSWSGYTAVPAAYSSSVFLNSLEVHGTLVSNEQSYFLMPGCFPAAICSGFNSRTYTYDTDLIDDPPPLIPSTSEDYRFTIWEEVPVEE